MKALRWLAGSLAAIGLILATAPAQRAEALSLANPGLVAPLKDAARQTTEVRFHGGGHGFHRGFHGGGFHRFHGGFYRPRFYGYPYYVAPVYRCPLVMTIYGPRRICAYRRHHFHYWRFHHRHHIHRFHHRRWM